MASWSCTKSSFDYISFCYLWLVLILVSFELVFKAEHSKGIVLILIWLIFVERASINSVIQLSIGINAIFVSSLSVLSRKLEK